MIRAFAVAAVLLGSAVFIIALARTPPPRPKKIATREDVLRAEALPSVLEPLRRNAQPKLAPAEGDWLAEHEEAGQSLEAHRLDCAPVPGRVVYLVPTGPFTAQAEQLLSALEPLLAAHFQLPVKRLPALDGAVAGKSARDNSFGPQWLTTDILEALRAVRPADAAAVMAVTTVDLYPDPAWNFVFGEASYEERVGVTSLARMGDLAVEPTLMLERTYTTSMHEIGHMLQLLHCIAWECPMNGSNHQDEADARPLEPCPHCLAKLMRATGLEPRRRFTELRAAFEAAGLKRGVEEIDRELGVLTP